MNNKPTPPAPESVNPLPSEIQKLTPQAAAVRVVEQSTIANRAFILVAMLLLHLKTTLKAGQTLGGLVIKLADVKTETRRRVKSTIDNARYAMRVWEELVTPGHITAEQFQGFTFGDCLTINAAMSGKSRQKLTGADVALILQASPKNWHEEIDCLATYGQTLDERAAVEAKNEAKKADKAADSTTTTNDEQGSAGASPAAEGASPSDSETETPASNIIESGLGQSGLGKKPTAEDGFKVIANLEQLIAAMEPDEVAKVAVALAELNDTVQSSLVAKPKPARRSLGEGGKLAAKRKVAKRPTGSVRPKVSHQTKKAA